MHLRSAVALTLASALLASSASADETKKPPPDPPLTGSGDRSPPQQTVAKVNIVVGGTLIFGGILTGLAGLLKKHSIDNACPDKQCPAEEAADVSTLRGYENVTNALWLGGGVILLSGIGLYLYADDPKTQAGPGSGDNAEKTSGASLRIAPSSNGVLAIGTF
jgi:hypothetical protein